MTFNLLSNKHKKQIIENLPLSGDSLAIATLQTQQNHSPILVISNDAYHATRLKDEISLFAPKCRTMIFPDYGILPYELRSVAKDITAARLLTLRQITLGQLDIVIVPNNALHTRLPPLTYINSRVFSLKVSDKLSITELRCKLINGNYSLTEQVYEPGEFAVRGGIIDIIPMGSKDIIRIDLFDDEIESLKLLNPKSKELIKTIQNFELIPAREYPTDSASLKHFTNRFREKFPESPANLRLLHDASNGILPPGSEFYLPLFFDNTSSIFDYLDDNWQIVYYANTLNILELNWQDINKRCAYFSHQYPCLKPADLFLTSETIFAAIKNHKSFELDLASTEELSQQSLSSERRLGSVNSNSQFSILPDLSVHNDKINPLVNLDNFRHTHNDKIILVLNSIGRIEIMRQTLQEHGFTPEVISNLDIATTNKNIYIIQGMLYNGFICNNTAFITEQELYKDTDTRIIKRRKKVDSTVDNDTLIRDLAEIQVGDFVVHVNHGIGKYLGLTIQEISDIEYEMLEIEYQGGSKLFIPIYNLHMISRYSKLDNVATEMSTLGSSKWNKIKKKCIDHAEDIAANLLELYAKREMESGRQFTIPSEYTEFCNSFGYEPTVDQESCFNAIIDDMTAKKPMDRLICGDVGFGKTEVAIRAAFIAAMNATQVAVLTPTTLLTEQHFQNFSDRFAGFPIRIAEISRFKTKKEITQTLENVKNGKIDILIGTHRLIQKDIEFAKLGLVIVDEEHKFGVKQKERLKELRANVDFLALTATPIPRSLSMALDGLRDFSIIATPPRKRLAINTQICFDDDHIIREAILREIRRGGQVFFLYNDVANIKQMHERLSSLMPDLQIAVAHGQMHEHTLEQTIRDFILQRYHILLCSTIIESGIDIANANTIIIYAANNFGLAQLHQLRGRVGRSYHQAYCYLIVPEVMSKDAEKRLDAVKMTSELGSGFNLAMHDLEIRGAGEILGDSQSGDIKHVGLSLYTEILKKAIKKLKQHEKAATAQANNKFGHLDGDNMVDLSCEVNLNATCILPNSYCPDVHERLIYYKRLAKAVDVDEIDEVYQSIMDKLGLPLDETVKNLVSSHYLRVKSLKLGIQRLEVGTDKLTLTFIDNPPITTTKIIALMQKLKTCKYDGKNKLIWQTNSANTSDKIRQANFILDELSNPAIEA